MSTTWHAEPQMLTAYAAGRLDDVRASSLEAHLLTCDACRAALAGSVPTAPLDRVWQDVVERIDTPAPGFVERALLALRVPGHAARLIAVTPSLRGSWLIAEAIALTFAVVAANATSGARADTALFLFLVLAALLPVAGVAVAFGPRVDPAYEIGVAAPIRADRLLLMRAAAVLAVSIVITGLAAIAMPVDAIAAAWLLPSLGLTLATLAAGTWLRPFVAAATVALAWVAIAVVAAAATGDRLAAFRPFAQVACILAIAVSGAVLVHRRSVLEEGILA